MFHVKHNLGRPRRALIAPAVGVTLLLATACATIASPTGWAGPAIKGTTVFAQTESGVITALRISGATATPLRSWPGDDDDVELTAIYATPIVDNNAVYIASYPGIIVALDIETFTPIQRWGVPIDIGEVIVATPVLRDGLLYVVTQQGTVLTIDITTGERTTLVELDNRIWGRPAVDTRHVYVAALDSDLLAIDRSSGKLQWKRNVGTVAGDLVIDGDLLLVGSFDRRLHALDLTADGAERWPDGGRGDDWFWARPLVAGDTVYAATVAGTVYAFNRSDGSQRWSIHLDDTEIRVAPVLLDGVLVIASRDGYLYGINPSTGVERWTKVRDGVRFLANPLVLESDGVVLYSDDAGNLLMVTAANGEAQLLFEHD